MFTHFFNYPCIHLGQYTSKGGQKNRFSNRCDASAVFTDIWHCLDIDIDIARAVKYLGLQKCQFIERPLLAPRAVWEDAKLINISRENRYFSMISNVCHIPNLNAFWYQGDQIPSFSAACLVVPKKPKRSIVVRPRLD